jgi:hypothetical protein
MNVVQFVPETWPQWAMYHVVGVLQLDVIKSWLSICFRKGFLVLVDEYGFLGRNVVRLERNQLFGATYDPLYFRTKEEGKCSGCDKAQAVSRRLPTAAARVQTQVRSCGICDVQSGIGAGILRVLLFLLPILLPPTASHSSINRGWYNKPISDRRTK